jgi:hypothetical protein
MSSIKPNVLKTKIWTNWGDNDLSPEDKNRIEHNMKPEIKSLQTCILKFSPTVNVMNNSMVIKKKVEQFTKIYRITLGTLISMSILLIITSFIGYKYPIQKTGYKCLTCANNYYLKNTGSIYCSSKKLFNEICSSSNECRTDLGLDCNKGICQCGSSKIWSNTNPTSCVPKRTYNESCNEDSECKSSEYLYCLSGTCKYFQYIV